MGEVQHLQWRDVDMERRKLYVRNKHGHKVKDREERAIDLTAAALAAIGDLTPGAPGEYVIGGDHPVASFGNVASKWLSRGVCEHSYCPVDWQNASARFRCDSARVTIDDFSKVPEMPQADDLRRPRCRRLQVCRQGPACALERLRHRLAAKPHVRLVKQVVNTAPNAERHEVHSDYCGHVIDAVPALQVAHVMDRIAQLAHGAHGAREVAEYAVSAVHSRQAVIGLRNAFKDEAFPHNRPLVDEPDVPCPRLLSRVPLAAPALAPADEPCEKMRFGDDDDVITPVRVEYHLP